MKKKAGDKRGERGGGAGWWGLGVPHVEKNRSPRKNGGPRRRAKKKYHMLLEQPGGIRKKKNCQGASLLSNVEAGKVRKRGGDERSRLPLLLKVPVSLKIREGMAHLCATGVSGKTHRKDSPVWGEDAGECPKKKGGTKNPNAPKRGVFICPPCMRKMDAGEWSRSVVCQKERGGV